MKAVLIPLVAMAFALCTSGAFAQTAKEIRGPAGGRAARQRAPGEDHHRSPLADLLAHGRVVVQYRGEHLRIVQLFGPAALDVSLRQSM
jgi:hypothetical protein